MERSVYDVNELNFEETSFYLEMSAKRATRNFKSVVWIDTFQLADPPLQLV